MLLAVVLGLILALAQKVEPPGSFVMYEFDSVQTFRCDFTESDGRRTDYSKGTTVPATKETFSDLVVDSIDYRRS